MVKKISLKKKGAKAILKRQPRRGGRAVKISHRIGLYGILRRPTTILGTFLLYVVRR